jgi:hypothetical protein
MFELFHDIAQAESATVRRFIVEHGHKADVSFRNVSYDEVRADLVAHGGTTTPALWDGAQLFVGEAAIVGRLSRR